MSAKVPAGTSDPGYERNWFSAQSSRIKMSLFEICFLFLEHQHKTHKYEVQSELLYFLLLHLENFPGELKVFGSQSIKDLNISSL